MSLISKPRRRGEAAASPPDANPARRRPWTLSALHRNVAGSIAVSLFTQLGLLMSGVAGARILGVLDRGRSALLLLFATVLPLLGTLGTPLAVTYWIARDERVGLRVWRQIRRIVVGQTAALVLVHACVLLVVFRSAPAHVQVAAFISLFGTPSIVAFFYALAVLQGTQDFRALNLCRLIFPPLNAAVLIVMLVTGVGGLWLVTTVWVALYSLSALAAALWARRALIRVSTDDHDPASVPATREMLSFGLKALLGSMSPLTGFQLDQAIVGLFISQAALGIYVVAVAFTNLPRFVAQSIGLVAYPHVAADGSRRGQVRAIIRFTGLTLLLCGIVVGATELALGFLVPHLFGAAFASAVGVGRILLISALFFCLTRVLSDCARGAGRPSLGTIAEVVSLGLLFPFVALLSASGAKGVALALVLASAAGVISIVIGLMIPARNPRPAGGRARRAANSAESSLAGAADAPPAAVEA
jgi:O-antigen/teichoic acid export membrane protein